jgi:chromosome segregation ATPase
VKQNKVIDLESRLLDESDQLTALVHAHKEELDEKELVFQAETERVIHQCNSLTSENRVLQQRANELESYSIQVEEQLNTYYQSITRLEKDNRELSMELQKERDQSANNDAVIQQRLLSIDSQHQRDRQQWAQQLESERNQHESALTLSRQSERLLNEQLAKLERHIQQQQPNVETPRPKIVDEVDEPRVDPNISNSNKDNMTFVSPASTYSLSFSPSPATLASRHNDKASSIHFPDSSPQLRDTSRKESSQPNVIHKDVLVNGHASMDASTEQDNDVGGKFLHVSFV